MSARNLISLLTLALCLPAVAQHAAHPPKFAVVSITPHDQNFRATPPGPGTPGPILPGGKYINHQAALYLLLWFAYPESVIPNETLTGLPMWAYSGVGGDGFDFEAEADPGTNPSRHEMRLMMRAALADRFKLRFHMASAVMPVYFLEVAKGGPHGLTKATPGEPATPPIISGGSTSAGIVARSASMRALAIPLGAYFLNRPVLDRTGLQGDYDFSVQPPPGMTPRPGQQPDRRRAILWALQQLGLTLVAGKAEVPVMVVDHVERPSRNP